MENSIKHGNLAAVSIHEDWWDNYYQIGQDTWPAEVLNEIHRLRRNFQKEFYVELYWLNVLGRVNLYVECENFHKHREMDYWIRGFMAHANPTPATFMPGPDSEKDVHTEHCCYEHCCKYGDEDCPVEKGTKSQSFPCPSCDGAEDTWGL
jgi:hypothetical protein